MPNYSLKFGVSEVAKLLNVERNVIKTWAFNFSKYLQCEASPPEGMIRQFSLDDLRVLTYVSFYWEQDPDIVCIQYGLNANEHFESPYNEFIKSIIPLFSDIPGNVEEYCAKGLVFEGLSEFGNTLALAHSYKRAGDILLDAALENDEKYELACPVIYNYRHATELYLKSAIGTWKKNHDFLPLYYAFKKLMIEEFNSSIPEWFENIILSFNDIDPKGTTFRYGGELRQGEMFVDLTHMKTLMEWFAETFKQIEERRRRIIKLSSVNCK